MEKKFSGNNDPLSLKQMCQILLSKLKMQPTTQKLKKKEFNPFVAKLF
jgi:hypothetical protein